MLNQIGKTIKEARIRAHFSQTDLAVKIGMAPPQLCNIEGGKNLPSIKTLERIAAALNIQFETLLVRYDEDAESFKDVHGRSIPETDILTDYTLMPVREYKPRTATVLTAEIKNKVDEILTLERQLGIPSDTRLQMSHPFINDERGAEILAGVLRTSCSVGMAPVVQLPETLESHNVKIITADLPVNEQSRSYYVPELRSLIIVIGLGNTPERNLYRLAYELGYASLYCSTGFHTVIPTEKAHRFVRRFAAAFLMPEESVRVDAALLALGKRDWTFEILLRLKYKYGVSAEAFALRLEMLGLIDQKLREYFRDKLRQYYLDHPDAMEPPPCRNSIHLDGRLSLLKLRVEAMARIEPYKRD